MVCSGTGRTKTCLSGKIPDMNQIEDLLDAVGPRLRALRRHRRVTLADLAATTGISQSTLSRLESGQRRANLQLLLPLASAYGVPLDDLVGAPRTGDPRIHLKSIQRHGLTFIPLTRRAGGMQAYKMIVPSGTMPDDPVPQTHEGYEWVYVLNGQPQARVGRTRPCASTRRGRRVRHQPAARTGKCRRQSG